MLKKVFLFALLAMLCYKSDGAEQNLNEFRERVERGTHTLFTQGFVSEELKRTLGPLELRRLFQERAEDYLDPALVCTVCNVFVDAVIDIRRSGGDAELITNYVSDACTNLNIQAEHVCRGVISVNMGTIVHIIDKANLTSDRFCALALQNFHCEDPERVQWEIDIHEGETIEKKQGSKESMKVLHLTDIHYDPIYEIGSLANCDLPMCCQFDSGVASDPADRAGTWTHHNYCDIPLHTYQDTLRQINHRHPDIEYVYYTGDIIAHRVWDTTKENNTKDLRVVYGIMADYFKDIPVYPALGNHEPHPVDLWSPNNVEASVSTHWIFEVIAQEWSRWLPEEALETVRIGGYYTLLTKQGLRIVVLNSNIAYSYNWWLLYDDVDNFGQLKWLENVLYKAELNRESVHILSHIPSGDSSSYIPWCKQYNRLLKRYQNTIRGIFNGHTHDDELHVYLSDENPAEGIQVAYNGGSLTPFNNKNPNYRIFSVDKESFELLDFEEWIFDVEKANANPHESPEWYMLYSFKDAYNVSSLEADDLAQLMHTMVRQKDKALLKQYTAFKSRLGPQSADPCDDDCLKGHLCRMVTALYGEDKFCEYLISQWI